MILLDTNFLLIPTQFKVDIFEEIHRITEGELCITDRSVQELAMLAVKAKQKDAVAAKIGLALLKQKHLKVVPSSSENSVDSSILDTLEPGDVLCTQDKDLKAQAKAKGNKVITLRNKSHLEFD